MAERIGPAMAREFLESIKSPDVRRRYAALLAARPEITERWAAARVPTNDPARYAPRAHEKARPRVAPGTGSECDSSAVLAGDAKSPPFIRKG